MYEHGLNASNMSVFLQDLRGNLWKKLPVDAVKLSGFVPGEVRWGVE